MNFAEYGWLFATLTGVSAAVAMSWSYIRAGFQQLTGF